MSVRPGIAFALAIVAGLLVGLTGCGDGKSKVRGKVTHNNKALVWGTVTLIDKNGQYHQADIDLSGNFELENVPEGTVKITVVSPNPYAAARPDPGKGRPGGGGGIKDLEDPREKFMAGKEKSTDNRPKPPPGAWFPIPDKYSSPDAGLTGTVKKGQPLDIDLK